MIIKSDYIRDKLTYIESKVKNDTKQKLYDINTTAEYIFMHILNDVYGWQLVNANDIKPNFPAIDLIDTTNEIVIQVTSSIDDSKVTSTIEKFERFADDNYKNGEYKIYAHYQLMMFYIKDKPKKFTKATETKIANQNMDNDDFLGIEDINTKVSANPSIATKVFKTLCEILHDKVCDSDISPQLTTKLGKSTIIGREKELQEIKEHLNNSKALLVNGIGGLGKSTIASYYLHQNKNEFDYYGFFEGLDDFVNKLEIALNLKIEQGQDRLAIVLHELTKLDGNKLLVIDNIQEVTENQKIIEKILDLKEHEGFRILLTSREEIDGIDKYLLYTLSLDDSKELFNFIYKVEDEVLLEEILEYLDYHAFFVEKTAMSIKKTLTPQMIRDKFENGDFSKISVKRKENFNKYLNELFTLDTLDEGEILMLKQLSVLPSHEISFDNIQLILDKDNDEDFEDLLNYLTQMGWVQQIKSHYKLHQIIKEYIFSEHSPSFQNIEIIIDFFYKLLSNSDSKVILFMQYNISFLDSLFKIFQIFRYEDEFNEKIVDFLNPLAHTYHKLSRLKNARDSYELAVEISERILDINSKSRVFTYGNIANFYLVIEEYQLALNFVEKGFLEATKIYGTSDINKILSFYMSKANILMKYKGCKDAIPIYEKIINIRVKYYGENDLSVGETFNNLGVCFSKEKIYDKAEMCLVKSLQIYMNFYKNKHPDMISITMNLAEVFMLKNNKKEAFNWYNKSLDMSLAYWGENHLDTALVYYNFSKYYFKYTEYRKAKECLLKTIKTQKIFLEHNHSQLLNSIDGLKLIEEKLSHQKNIISTKIKRNDPCPCNSGKKYKKCCGKPK